MIISPPPNTHTSKPKFAAPPFTCDTHVHVFGPAAQYPPVPDRDYEPSDAPLEKLLAMHRSLGIERGVIVHPLVYGRDHSAMLDALRATNGRYRGTAHVDERTTSAELHAFHDAGVRGIRVHFFRFHAKAPDLGALRRVVDRIAPFGWHVLILIESSDLVAFGPTLLSLGVPFVIDHMGHPNLADGLGHESFQYLLELMADKNCWAKISSGDRHSAQPSPYLDAIPFIRAMAKASPDRTIWGTNWPHVMYKHMYQHPELPGDPLPDEGDLLNLLYDGVGAIDAVKKILVDNPAKLYGFG